MDAYRAINEILVHLFNEIWELEEKAVITDEYKDITNNDMHIIEAVGLGKGNNMTAIAKKLKITVGSLTTSMNSLVNKKYVVRERSAEDRRVVNIRLTKKGERAYQHHADFHRKMTDAVVSALQEEEIPVLVKTLDSLSAFFKSYREEDRYSFILKQKTAAGSFLELFCGCLRNIRQKPFCFGRFYYWKIHGL